MANPINAVLSQLRGLLMVSPNATWAAVEKLIQKQIEIPVTATLAGTTVLQGGVACLHGTQKVIAAKFANAGTTVAASATNYATLKLYRKSATATTLVASLASTSAWTTGLSLDMTLTGANLQCAAGETLCWEMDQSAGTGVGTWLGTIDVVVQETD